MVSLAIRTVEEIKDPYLKTEILLKLASSPAQQRDTSLLHLAMKTSADVPSRYSRAEILADIASSYLEKQNGRRSLDIYKLTIVTMDSNMWPCSMQMALSRGMVGTHEGEPEVGCPFHKCAFSLANGCCLNSNEVYKVKTYPGKLSWALCIQGFIKTKARRKGWLDYNKQARQGDNQTRQIALNNISQLKPNQE